MMQSTIRFTRRIMTLLLAVVMLFGTLMTTADAANRDNVRYYDTYMCIGDSIAAGFYIDGERAGYYRTRMTGAYHDIIANATHAELNQFGWSAFRAVELRYMLEGVRYDLDDVWLNSFRPLVNDQLLDANKEDYLKAIRESDLITVNLGSNDVLSYTMSKTVMQLQSSSDCELAAKVKEIAGKCGDIGTAFVKVLGYAAKGSDAGGYGGDIVMMVGFKADKKTVVCYKVLAASETPGLGSNLTTPEFSGQFAGKDGSSLSVKKDGGEIEAITSATITSRAVCRAIADAQKKLAGN